VKSSETSRERGYDAGRVNGRRRHILMDTMGPLLMVLVFSANAQGREPRSGKSEAEKTQPCPRFLIRVSIACSIGFDTFI
jgi:hypothetical protein